MLGSTKAQTGYSYWVGTQFPSLLTEDGRWGLEYNHGSKYWRAITYGEDTLAGSKIAARGSAYEAYFTEYLVEEQLRYTYIDYDYSGSNGFFGNKTGIALKLLIKLKILDSTLGINTNAIGVSVWNTFFEKCSRELTVEPMVLSNKRY